MAIGFRSAADDAVDVRQQIEALGRKACTVQGHVGSKEDCERMHDELVRALGGPVDILVNSAGIHRNNLFLTMEDHEWQEVLETNLMGTVHPTRAVGRSMWARRSGRIINLSSVAAHAGGRGQANYAASKGAIESLTQNLSVEFAPRNVTVNCISPGAIDTTMWVGTDTGAVIGRQLVKRLGRPDEIAAWVVMLASEHGAFVTGQVISVDGGWMRGWEVGRKGAT